MKKNKFKFPNSHFTIIDENPSFEEQLKQMGDTETHPVDVFLEMMECFSGTMSTHINKEVIKWCLNKVKERDEMFQGSNHYKDVKEEIEEYL